MSIATNIRNQVRLIIDDWGTEVTLQTVTPVKNAYGAITSYTVTGTGTCKSVPSNFMKNQFGLQPFGNLNEGEVRMMFQGGTAFTDLKGTADSWRAVMNINHFMGTYIPRIEKPIIMQGIEVAIPVVFRLDVESGY